LNIQRREKKILPAIVFSQFAGTSIWFVGNAVLPELKETLHLSQYAVSLVTSAVMLGFVAGTLAFAILSLADRFSPTRLFFISAVLGALCNAAVIWLAKDGNSLFVFRFAVGFFLAGIYPVGMKVAADWYKEGLGKAMGFLLGALVLGTAFPYLLKNRDFELPWKNVLLFTSAFTIIGGLVMLLFVGDGPYRHPSGGFKWNAIGRIFSSKKWRQAALGYFGHMWELYTFWAFVPVIISIYAERHSFPVNVALLSFIVIAIGSFACIAGGYLSAKWGSAKVSFLALLLSGTCCFLSPFMFDWSLPVFISIILLWGFAVIPDSPQFSTLIAQFSPVDLRGTALTINNSIGFSISSASIFIIDLVHHSAGFFSGRNSFILLGLGALCGLPFIYRLIRAMAKRADGS
jgi:MFS family permease